MPRFARMFFELRFRLFWFWWCWPENRFFQHQPAPAAPDPAFNAMGGIHQNWFMPEETKQVHGFLAPFESFSPGVFSGAASPAAPGGNSSSAPVPSAGTCALSAKLMF